MHIITEQWFIRCFQQVTVIKNMATSKESNPGEQGPPLQELAM